VESGLKTLPNFFPLGKEKLVIKIHPASRIFGFRGKVLLFMEETDNGNVFGRKEKDDTPSDSFLEPIAPNGGEVETKILCQLFQRMHLRLLVALRCLVVSHYPSLAQDDFFEKVKKSLPAILLYWRV